MHNVQTYFCIKNLGNIWSLQHFSYVCSIINLDVKSANASQKNTEYFKAHYPVFHILVKNDHQDP
jgi:hypothetical protein